MTQDPPQPAPHYCEQRLTDDGTITGCPDWPACLFPNAPGPIPADPPHAPTDVRAHAPARALGAALLWSAVVLVVVAIGVLWTVLA